MNRPGAALCAISILIGAALGCSSSARDPDSETHWLDACNADSDCGRGLWCLCNTCTRPCGEGDCRALDKSATCITPTADALSENCELAPGIALCGRACAKDANCSSAGADLRCIGGACLGGAPTGGTSRTPSPATWVADLVDTYCTWGIRCGKYPDGATCRASRGYFVTDGFNSASAAVTAVSKGTADFDDAAATACLAEISRLDCSHEFWAPPTLPASCTATFSGHLMEGGTCIDDVECGTGLVCVVQSTVTCEGTCTALAGSCHVDADCPANQYCQGVSWWGPGLWTDGTCSPVTPPGAEGEPCGTPAQCAPGLTCVASPPALLCAAAASEGESCGVINERGCAPGLACVESDDGKTKTCIPGAKLGDSCTALFQCGAQYLSNDLICDVTGSHTCVRKPSTGSCVLVSGINTCDPVTSYCDGSGSVGTCKPWLAPGAPCVFPTNGFDPCGSQASCQGSGSAARCTLLGPVCAPK